MNKQKLLICVLLISVFTFIATGLAFAADTETVTCPESGQALPQPRVIKDRAPLIGMMFTAMAAESTQRILHHYKLEFEHRGWESILVTDAETANLQRDAFETFMNKNVDAIFLVFPEMERIADLVIQAREKGIGVYCIDTELRPGVILNPTQANGVAGSMVFYYGLERVHRKGQMLIMGVNTHFGVRQRMFAARGLAKDEWPLLEVAGFEWLPSPGWDRAAFDIATNYLTRLGEDLKWIFGGWDTCAILGSRALEQQGYTIDDVIATGIDGGTEAWEEIRSDSPFCATLSQPFEEYAHYGYEMFKEIQIDGIGIGTTESTLPASRTIYVQGVLTTQENVPPNGTVVHEFFKASYYDPEDTEAWYNWGDQYIVGESVR